MIIVRALPVHGSCPVKRMAAVPGRPVLYMAGGPSIRSRLESLSLMLLIFHPTMNSMRRLLVKLRWKASRRRRQAAPSAPTPTMPTMTVPPEILKRIIGFLSRSDLAALMAVSTSFADLTAPRLYREIDLVPLVYVLMVISRDIGSPSRRVDSNLKQVVRLNACAPPADWNRLWVVHPKPMPRLRVVRIDVPPPYDAQVMRLLGKSMPSTFIVTNGELLGDRNNQLPASVTKIIHLCSGPLPGRALLDGRPPSYTEDIPTAVILVPEHIYGPAVASYGSGWRVAEFRDSFRIALDRVVGGMRWTIVGAEYLAFGGRVDEDDEDVQLLGQNLIGDLVEQVATCGALRKALAMEAARREAQRRVNGVRWMTLRRWIDEELDPEEIDREEAEAWWRTLEETRRRERVKA